MSAKNLTLSISPQTSEKMEKFSEVNWSKIARDAIEQYVNDRLNTKVSPDLLIRLRNEKGEEYANGKKLALETISPKITYKRLAKFFEKVYEKAEEARSNEANERGMPEEYVSIDIETIAISYIRDFITDIPKDSTDEFCKGIFSVLNDVWGNING